MKNNYYELDSIMQSALFFLLFSFLARRGNFFRLNHVRKVRKRCSHSRFSFQAIILGFFDQNVGLFVFFGLLWATVAIFVQSSNDVR